MKRITSDFKCIKVSSWHYSDVIKLNAIASELQVPGRIGASVDSCTDSAMLENQ